MSIKEQVKEALEKDINLSDEEMQEKFRKEDEHTKAQGIEGESILDEDKRLKRMAMNYFGTKLNISLNILATLHSINERLGVLLNLALPEQPKEEVNNE